jgi:hypothetical protein
MTDLIYKPRMSWRDYEAHLKAHDYNMNTPRLWVSQYGWKEASRMQDEDESIDTTFIEIDPEDGRTNTLAPATAGDDE